MRSDECENELIEKYRLEMIKEFEDELAEKAKRNEDWSREDEDKVDQDVAMMIFAFFITMILLLIISAFLFG